MNESGFNPTFAQEGQTFDDLNQAHQADEADGGNREEGVYPTQNVHLDNARHYGQQVGNAQTHDELDAATRPMVSMNPETGLSEFDERTGVHQEATKAIEDKAEERRGKIESWEKQKDSELAYIQSSADVDKLKTNLDFAQAAFDRGDLGEAQLAEIKRAAEQKRDELWDKRKAEELQDIADSTSVNMLQTNLEAAQRALEGGYLGEAQLAEIKRAGEQKQDELWDKRKAEELQYIADSPDIGRLSTNLEAAQRALEGGYLGEAQLAEIKRAAEQKRDELWDKRKAEELQYIADSTSVNMLQTNLEAAQRALEGGYLGEAQLEEIKRAGEQKRTALEVAAAVGGN